MIHRYIVTKELDIVEMWLLARGKCFDVQKVNPIIGSPILPKVLWAHKVKIFESLPEAFDYVRPFYVERIRHLQERLAYETKRYNTVLQPNDPTM